jgi:mRNA-degrading endonuclease RelE of RelBE toxin-antitoxin system
MAAYTIDVSDDAKVDLSFYTAFERKIIVSSIRTQLQYQPLTETRRRKKLRDNPVATWELRIGRYRVFYEVVQTTATVSIVAVGLKEHNKLFIRGQEVQL